MHAAVLFDLDNTLIDRSAAHVRYCQEFTERFLPDWSPAAKQTAIREMIEYDNFGYTSRRDYFQWMATRFVEGKLRPDELWEEYRAKLPSHLTIHATIGQLLIRLSKRHQLAIVTNGSSHVQRGKLDRAGLAGLCSHVFISEEVGVGKPHPAIFQLALASLGCQPEDALFVGDDPRNDMAGAAKLGMSTCWIRMGRLEARCPARPTFQVETVLEIESVLL